ncbi:two-component response regulator-like PRR95 isoform X2 [Aristolochia californica]|uniref:two-component response regulator-like PRR95 isoform X2 n=1 Tax=Aristolochia californica TaxID=171875 RepID=UPI0035DD1A10
MVIGQCLCGRGGVGIRMVAVADGLKAWETLQEKACQIDLVLTEVELPSVTGFCLLTMIMEHEACKDIPVIMMSSQDCISMVLNCMMRGAADFLVKPIRRNELRNLWQHVWRRQSSTGVLKEQEDGNFPPQKKLDAVSENNAASNHSSDNVVCTKKKMESSDTRSDSQSSCAKPDADVESPYTQNMREDLVPLAPVKEGHNFEECGKLNSTLSISEKAKVKLTSEAASCNQVMGSIEMSIEGKPLDKGASDEDLRKISEPCREAIDFIGAIDNRSQCNYMHFEPTYVREDDNVQNCVNEEHFSEAKNFCSKSTSLPFLELSLMRPQPCASGNNEVERKHPATGGAFWNHSNASAFSWYNNKITRPHNRTMLKQVQTTNYNSEPRESSCGPHSPLFNKDPLDATDCPRVGVTLVPVPIRGTGYDGLNAGYGALLQPVFYGHPRPPLWSANPVNQSEGFHENSNQSDQEAHHAEESHYLHDQNTCKSIYKPVPRHDQLESDGTRHGASFNAQSGSSGICNGSKSYINSSAFGSECNGSNRNITHATVVESGTDEGPFTNDGFRVVDYRSSQREAALIKFRLKRKDRCFEKKVRYQSRKRLAEQRPRVKGQFVRQVQSDS